jgi:hypothetical protein
MSNTTSPNESEIAGVEMPEPRAWLHRQGGCAEVSERQLDADEIARGWTQEPLFTADQLRQAVEAERARFLSVADDVFVGCSVPKAERDYYLGRIAGRLK